MKKYLLFGAVALCLMPTQSQANIVSARIACALYAAPALAVCCAAARAAAHEHQEQPIYFKSGPTIFGDDFTLGDARKEVLPDIMKEAYENAFGTDLMMTPPQKPATTPYDVAKQMIIHNNSI